MPFRGIFLFAFLVGSLPACFFWPFYGVLLWTVIAFLNPQSALFYWGPAAAFPWAVAVAVPTFAGFLFFSRGWTRRLASGELMWIVALWIWFTVTSYVSTSNSLFVHHAAETWYRWGFVSKILVMTVFTMAAVDTFARLRTYVLVMASCFGYFVLKSFPFILMTGGHFRIYGPDFSMIADNNDFGLALNMTLPLFFFLAKTEPRRIMRWFWGFLFLIAIPAIFFTYSRGAVVGLIAVVLMMILRLRQRVLLIPVVALGVSFALMFAPTDWKNRMDPTRPGALDASAQERLNAWAFARNLAAEFPIAGGGFATFTPELFERYAPHGNDFHGSHSIYFQVLAEHGFVGLGLYLALVLTCVRSLWQVARIGRRCRDRQLIHYSNMFLLSFLGFLASGTFLGRAYFDYFFTMVACAAILKRIARQRYAEAMEMDEDEEMVSVEDVPGEAAPLLSSV